jgi:hypothetical protein
MALCALSLPFVVVGAAVVADKGGFSFGGHAISPSRWVYLSLLLGLCTVIPVFSIWPAGAKMQVQK